MDNWSNVRKNRRLSVLEASFKILCGSDSNKEMIKELSTLLSYLRRRVFNQDYFECLGSWFTHLTLKGGPWEANFTTHRACCCGMGL